MTKEVGKSATKSQARHRSLGGWAKVYFMGVTIISVSLCIIFVFKISVFEMVMLEASYFSILIAAFVSSTFLLFPATKNASREKIPLYDIILAAASVVGPLYVAVFAMDIMLEGWEVSPPPAAIFLGLITWALILEAVRRTGGMLLASVILIISIYPLFAHWMPGVFMAKHYSLQRIVGFHFLGTESIYGLPTRVFSRLVIGYMVLAVTFTSTGAADFFFKFCLALLGHIRGGAAKVSILSSAFFAMMSGSAVANVVTTGAFTIPTMKRLGYPDYYAAAIEACASKGGTLSPPVMGITAFIMADFIGVSYTEVCIAASLPILLYWISLFAQSDFYAAKNGFKGLPREELPSIWQTLKEGWYYIFTLVVLVYFIFVEMLVAWAPFYASLALLIMINFRKATRLTARSLLKLTEDTGRMLTELMAILAGVGMIIGSLSLTGTAHSLTGTLSAVGGHHLFPLLIVGAFTSFLLGIGLTISACYIFLAMLLAPSLVSLGIHEMSAHLFLVYWGSVSFITPPVALAAYAAASLAGANPMKTGFQAVRLGFVSLLIPFFFVYNPALVAHGTLLEIFTTMATAIVGIILLSAGFEGYCFLLRSISIPVRILFMGAGFMLFFPVVSLKSIGLALIIVGIALHFGARKVAVARQPKAEQG